MEKNNLTGSHFEIGEWVVYPAHGVGTLDSIETFEIEGQKAQFFVVSFTNSKLTLRLPVTKAISSGLRKIIDQDKMDEALTILTQKARKRRVMWSKRAQEYEAKINSGDPISIAEVIRDLYRRGDDINQSFSERQIYQQAITRLSKELSIVKSLEETKAVETLEEILKAA